MEDSTEVYRGGPASARQPVSLLRQFLDEIALKKVRSKNQFAFAGTTYDLFDTTPLPNWLDLAAELIRVDNGSFVDGLEGPLLPQLARLLRQDDLQRLEVTLPGFHDLDGVDEFHFAGGFYSEVPKSRGWNRLRTTNVDPSPVTSDGKQIRITYGERLRLCEQFHDLGIVGNSPDMVSLYIRLEKIGAGIRKWPKQLPNVLLRGEPGTGKELVAQAVHKLTGRTGEFRAINCAGIPETLLESELFGHEKGAFTGAIRERKGYLEACNGGTLFLDEIDKVSPSLQAKLFRTLQEKEIQRIGATDSTSVDVLIVAATNNDLTAGETSIERALSGRLSRVVLELPPLRDRFGDVLLLLNAFLRRYPGNHVDDYRLQVGLWCMEQVPLMESNVRSLENLVTRLVYHFLDASKVGIGACTDPSVERKAKALDQAIEKALAAGVKSPPSRVELCKYLDYQGRKGRSRNYLHNDEWAPIVQVFVQAGRIRT